MLVSQKALKSKILHWNYLWLLLFAIGMGLFLIGMPKQLDDYSFMTHLKYWFDSQGINFPENGGNVLKYGLPLDGLADMVTQRWQIDNIRLANFLATILLIFPKWVGSGLMLLLLMLTILTGFRLSGIDTARSPLVPLALVMWTFLLPWDDNFGCLDFQLNYILPAWLGLTLLYRLRPEASHTWRDNLLNMFLALTMGATHEGSGIACALGLATLFICLKRWRRADVASASIIIIAAGIFLLSVPGMMKRSSGALNLLLSNPTLRNPRFWWDFFIYDTFPYTLFILTALATIIIMPKRLRNHSSLTLFTLVAATAGLAIRIASAAMPRMLFWPNAICIVAVTGLLLLLSERKFNRYNKLTAILSAGLLIPLFANLGFVGYYSLQCRHTMKQLLERRVAKPDVYNFGDAYMMGQVPAICGTRPGTTFATTAMLGTDDYYGTCDYEEERTWLIIPSQLQYVTPTSGTDIGTGQGIRRIGNIFFMPYDEDLYKTHYTGTQWNPCFVRIHIDYGDGPERWRASLFRFRSEADGKFYLWCLIRTNWYTTNFKHIQSFTIDG